MEFLLHPKLAADTVSVCELPLCHVLLMNDSTFPWLILVPRQENLRELFDLSDVDYQTAMNEVRFVAERFSAMTKADKINVAALGNMVPQLHIHVIARFASDTAWPNPVWNNAAPAQTYTPEALEGLVARLRALFA